MPESTALSGLPSLFFQGIPILLYLAAGILLMLAGRFLSKRKPNTPGLLLFTCYAAGVVGVLMAMTDLADLVSGLWDLFLQAESAELPISTDFLPYLPT
ncbi:MAG: hypothetical protein HUJ67_03485 [Ruminiclostridium sp.]|nr:hypothetical protein [Ruminiclostridium sp.]